MVELMQIQFNHSFRRNLRIISGSFIFLNLDPFYLTLPQEDERMCKFLLASIKKKKKKMDGFLGNSKWSPFNSWEQDAIKVRNFSSVQGSKKFSKKVVTRKKISKSHMEAINHNSCYFHSLEVSSFWVQNSILVIYQLLAHYAWKDIQISLEDYFQSKVSTNHFVDDKILVKIGWWFFKIQFWW